MTLMVLFVMMSLPGCYTLRQALHHNDLFNSRRPVAEVLEDPKTTPQTRAKLELVEKILAFAEAEGLNTKGAYRYYIETKDPVVSYVVQAAYPDRLEAVTWWFPVIGAVPYRGYFEKRERDAMADELRAKGYDVDLSGAGAFSSLGWFDDPIFSSMLQRGEADLAHLFFHELTHRTFWMPGSSLFNENLAEFVGNELAEKYLAAKGDREATRRYEGKREDRKLFHAWLVGLRKALEELYRNDRKLPLAELMQAKAELFARWQKPPLKPAFKVVDYVDAEPWNNASVLGASLYSPDTEAFAHAAACLPDRSVRTFLTTLERLAGETKDPFEALDRMCEQSEARRGLG